MHPILRDARRLGLYILGWVPVALIFLTVPRQLTWLQSASIVLPLSVIYAFICLLTLYTCRAYPLTGNRLVQNIWRHLAHSLGGGIFWALGAKLIAALIGIPPQQVNESLGVFFGAGVLVYLLSVAMHSAYLALETSQSALRREAEARLLASQSELRALRSQINPHFLYNSLNSISALTSIDPSRARQMCIQLSEFLRTTLGLSEKDKIPLELELDLVRRYLAIEKTRFGQRLQFEEDVSTDCLADRIPALILQPLVENAIVHGIAGIADQGTLRVTARHGASSQLSITVENSFDPDFPPLARRGFGLNSIRKRLETEYGSPASLAITTEASSFRAELLLPLVQVKP